MSNLTKKDITLLARAMEWQYRLNDYTDEQLKVIMAMVLKAKKEIELQLAAAKITDWSRERSLALLDEINDLLLGVAAKAGKEITSMTTTAGVHAHNAHSSILSFNGAASNVVVVTASAEQLRSIIEKVPVGGRTLQDWVDRTFTMNLKEKIREEVGVGILKGDSYRQLTNRLATGWPTTQRELETIAKTYVQSINVQAMQQVYKANPNIVRKVRWHATMEPRSRNGRGTCLRCAALDGIKFNIGEHPDCPLHPLCRCVLIPITARASAMALSQKDINKAARPYNITDDKVIGLGGRRKGVSGTTHINKYSDWFRTLSPTAQKNALGPARYKLIIEGKIKFKDMVDVRTGKLKTLKELR